MRGNLACGQGFQRNTVNIHKRHRMGANPISTSSWKASCGSASTQRSISFWDSLQRMWDSFVLFVSASDLPPLCCFTFWQTLCPRGERCLSTWSQTQTIQCCHKKKKEEKQGFEMHQLGNKQTKKKTLNMQNTCCTSTWNHNHCQDRK